MADDPNLLRLGDARIFIQGDGSSPTNPYNFYGCLSLGGLQEELGEGTPIYCPSPTQRNAWEIVDTVPSQPGLPTTDFTQHANRYLTDIWWKLRRQNCKFNAQVVLGRCQSPDDISQFDSKILLSGTRMTAFNLPALNPLDGGENTVGDITGTWQINFFDRYQPMLLGEKADATVLAEALDGLYADAVQCGDCGEPSDGCQKQFVLTLANSGSPGLSSQIAYTDDSWSTNGTDDINTLGGLSGNKVAQMGQRLVVISQATNSHHHKLISTILAGTAGGWAEVTSGYVLTKGPRAIYVKSANRAFIAAAGGYVYLLTAPTAAVTVLTDGSVTTQDFNAISGFGRTVVAVGNSNALIYSTNDGETFASKTGPEVGIALNAVECVNDRVWWVGTANGNLYYTTDAGNTWVENTPEGDLTVINSIAFVDELVGYVAGQAGAEARIYRTSTNGNLWSREAPDISGMPTAERINFVAPCPQSYNALLAGGRISSGGDGIVLNGEA